MVISTLLTVIHGNSVTFWFTLQCSFYLRAKQGKEKDHTSDDDEQSQKYYWIQWHQYYSFIVIACTPETLETHERAEIHRL